MRIRSTRLLLAACAALVAGLVAGLAAGPALALMPPYVYETARKEAASVIVIAVDEVKITPREFGACTVSGTVKIVERGSDFEVGKPVMIDVPCVRPNGSPPLGGTIYQDTARLQKARFGRAYLDKDGKVASSQYYPLDALP